MKHFKSFNGFLHERVNLDYVERIADDLMDPVDVEFTKHFFDRLTRKEHRGSNEITNTDLIKFFERLAAKKARFERFIAAYDDVIVQDRGTKINIPFQYEVDQIIAKTIMRKASFMSQQPQFKL